jgi:hypothetical protein
MTAGLLTYTGWQFSLLPEKIQSSAFPHPFFFIVTVIIVLILE